MLGNANAQLFVKAPRLGGLRKSYTCGCVYWTLKIWLSLYGTNFHPNTHPSVYTIFDRKVPYPILHKYKLGAFYNGSVQIHPFCVIWAPSSLMKTHRSLYQISQKKHPKRQIHILIMYTMSVWYPQALYTNMHGCKLPTSIRSILNTAKFFKRSSSFVLWAFDTQQLNHSI